MTEAFAYEYILNAMSTFNFVIVTRVNFLTHLYQCTKEQARGAAEIAYFEKKQ